MYNTCCNQFLVNVSPGKWNDEHCSSRRGFVCEKRQGAAPTNPVPPKVTGNCPGGYSADRFSNKCYRVFTTPMSWSNASKFCMGQGREKYYLASINSELDNGNFKICQPLFPLHQINLSTASNCAPYIQLCSREF